MFAWIGCTSFLLDLALVARVADFARAEQATGSVAAFAAILARIVLLARVRLVFAVSSVERVTTLAHIILGRMTLWVWGKEQMKKCVSQLVVVVMLSIEGILQPHRISVFILAEGKTPRNRISQSLSHNSFR